MSLMRHQAETPLRSHLVNDGCFSPNHEDYWSVTDFGTFLNLFKSLVQTHSYFRLEEVSQKMRYGPFKGSLLRRNSPDIRFV